MAGQEKMTRRIEQEQLGWWRFDRYEIKDGYIRPADGAHLVFYDPWAQQRRSKIDSSVPPPYQELLEMLKRLGVDYSHHRWDSAEIFAVGQRKMRLNLRAGVAHAPLREGSLSWETSIESEFDTWRRHPLSIARRDRDNNAILAWCNQFGLLGVLPHTALEVTLYPRRRGRGLFEHTVYTRLNGWWVPSSVGYDTRFHDARQKQITRVADFDESHALFCGEEQFNDDSGSARIEEQELDRTWGWFFPEVPRRARNRYQYPMPLSAEFWQEYAEPVPTFIRYALLFQQAIQPLSPSSELSEIIPTDFAVALANGLLAPASKQVTLSETRQLKHKWVYPSLLSALAAMAIEDLALGASIRDCLGCGKPFVSTAYQALYCSPNCAWRDRKRKARAASTLKDTPEKAYDKETRKQ
jgi:hypothetical protein